MEALILGHSFIRRLREWLDRNGRQMSSERFEVHLHGVVGRTIEKTLHLDMDVVDRLRPDAVFLQVGGNDITDILPQWKYLGDYDNW